jgi:hypothetical protein
VEETTVLSAGDRLLVFSPRLVAAIVAPGGDRCIQDAERRPAHHDVIDAVVDGLIQQRPSGVCVGARIALS